MGKGKEGGHDGVATARARCPLLSNGPRGQGGMPRMSLISMMDENRKMGRGKWNGRTDRGNARSLS